MERDGRRAKATAGAYASRRRSILPNGSAFEADYASFFFSLSKRGKGAEMLEETKGHVSFSLSLFWFLGRSSPGSEIRFARVQGQMPRVEHANYRVWPFGSPRGIITREGD